MRIQFSTNTDVHIRNDLRILQIQGQFNAWAKNKTNVNKSPNISPRWRHLLLPFPLPSFTRLLYLPPAVDEKGNGGTMFLVPHPYEHPERADTDCAHHIFRCGFYCSSFDVQYHHYSIMRELFVPTYCCPDRISR
jgi:hypothetical protein